MRTSLLGNLPVVYKVPSLPEAPIGDVFDQAEEGDYDEQELGDSDIEYEDGDVEEGAPKRRKLSAKELARKLANGTATSAEKSAFRALQKANPAVGNYVKRFASAAKAAKAGPLPYEVLKGAKLMTSTLGSGAFLRPTEISALKTAIHLSTPFEPLNVSVSGNTVDIEDVLSGLIGSSPFYYAGILITLSAAVDDINQGAVISVTRSFGTINAATQQVVNNFELSSGIGAVEMLLLNGVLIAGRPRFWAPLITPVAYEEPTPPDPEPTRSYKITFGNVPSSYSKSIRFLQPGDQQIDTFLKQL